ncbi:hypothetical protein [Roseomonas genomospecies 6]|uniref:Uncharacterized protein n=1 Tax=Roseomonas genomospecies 6 TaxID=214106 RepID=A0A9W7KNH0_9PROT|nr:hypothetical protein [Roseomonas genomospecies 6]KAA0675917.1 hypothetical protein DS843_29455 [Roseomonas genomospecies 6]
MLAIVLLSMLLSGFAIVVARILTIQVAAAGMPARDPWSPAHLRRVKKARQEQEEIEGGPSWASFPRAL